MIVDQATPMILKLPRRDAVRRAATPPAPGFERLPLTSLRREMGALLSLDEMAAVEGDGPHRAA